MNRDFVWRDAGRTVVFRGGAVEAAVDLLAELGCERFELLSTRRALATAPDLADAASAVHLVGPGQVPDLAAALLPAVAELPAERSEVRPPGEGGVLVALGGGRVIDTAKALAAVTGAAVAAIPTTLSGAEMTAIHRLPAGAEDRIVGMVRPRFVLADPGAMTGQTEAKLRASAINALAHGADSLYTPLANPVAELSTMHGARLLAEALEQPRESRDRAALALGALLCGYAIDSAGFGLHHVVCQSLVRVCGTPHAETNAAFLPLAVRFLAAREPGCFAELAAALGVTLDDLPARIRELAGDPPGLGALGAERACLPAAVEAAMQRPQLGNVPGRPSEREIAELIDGAW